MNVHRDNLPPNFEHRLYSSLLSLTECEGGSTVFPERCARPWSGWRRNGRCCSWTATTP